MPVEFYVIFFGCSFFVFILGMTDLDTWKYGYILRLIFPTILIWGFISLIVYNYTEHESEVVECKVVQVENSAVFKYEDSIYNANKIGMNFKDGEIIKIKKYKKTNCFGIIYPELKYALNNEEEISFSK